MTAENAIFQKLHISDGAGLPVLISVFLASWNRKMWQTWRLTFPELFTPVLPGEKSPFHWNLDKFTKRDLLELLTALCRAEAIVDDRGKPAAYARVVSSVAERLHLSISESSAYNERDTILNIKRNPAAFISHLVTCLTGSLKI